MRLFILHYHLRPGGVRRVIELATPHLAGTLRPRVEAVVVVSGEAPDLSWLAEFRGRLGSLPLVVRTDASLRYLAEQRGVSPPRHRLRRFLSGVFAPPCTAGDVVWAHNQALGRNLPLTRELIRICARRNLTLVFHHHDWWFDNRWQRWAEMRRAGFRSLRQVAAVTLPSSPLVRHAAINQADATVLRRSFGVRAAWLPNPADLQARPPERDVQRARRWLWTQLGDDAPIWLVPCRLLRRKNLAEALLLARWLRPEAWLVTTGGISSAEEETYARQLEEAAEQEGWQLRLGLLAGHEPGTPAILELLAASEVVLLTSLVEGFGLPFLEAAAARRPLLARALPNVSPDLARWGFRFPYSYEEILIDPRLFNWDEERRRQQAGYDSWKDSLPHRCRRQARPPTVLAAGARPTPVPFSRLTLDAQLEVLRQPRAISWRRCTPLNPFLAEWQAHIIGGGLQDTRWPRGAGQLLGGQAYARRFQQLLRAGTDAEIRSDAGMLAQSDFIRGKLRPENLYPLLWRPGG